MALAPLLFRSLDVSSEDRSSATTTAGKYIRSITINVGEIFEDRGAALYETANAIKTPTREDTVRRELLFREGDPYNPFLIAETARNLRLQRYLRDIKVIPTFDGDAVDIKVEARDSWTFIPYATYSSGTGRKNRGIGLAEGNLGGRGARLESRFQQQDTRDSYGVVYHERQLLSTRQNLLASAFERSDGHVYNLEYGLPFRSLLQRDSWVFDANTGNTIGRLFKGGDEEYIYRQRNDLFSALYTFAGPSSSPAATAQDQQFSGIYQGQRLLSRRYSVGYAYQSDDFRQADEKDYEDLDLDPTEVHNDFGRVPKERRFSGPMLQYRTIQPNFISMNYIDRFDRVEDYNLGDELFITSQIAPRALGSLDDAILGNFNRSRGWRFSDRSFLRGEVGSSSRFQDGELENTVLRTEMKFYNVLGDWFIGERYLGRHTFATNFFIDFGEDLDRDRQFLLGADNALRGYQANTFEGDKRLALNVEERAHLADDVLQLISLGTAVFADIGGASRDSLGTLLTDDLYGDIGFGFRIGFPRAAGSGVVRLDIALPLRDGPDGSGAFEPRFIFGAGQLFGSQLRSEVVGPENASVNLGFDR